MQQHGTVSTPTQRPGGDTHLMTSRLSRTRKLLFAALLLAGLDAPTGYLALRSPARSAPLKSVQVLSTGQELDQLVALAHADPSPANRLNLSAAYINSNRPGLAIQELEPLVKAQPTLARAWSNLCVAHTMQRDYRVAIENCHVALQLEPTFQLANNNLKWAVEEREKRIQELLLLQKQTPELSRTESYCMTAGVLQLQIGNYDDAITLWQKALGLNPQNTPAANNTGTAYMLKRQVEQAVPWFQRALILDPTSQLAKNNLAWAAAERQEAN